MVDTSYDKFEKVIYNGYEFPWGTTYRLFGAPVRDDANRTIRFWEYTLTADWIGEFDDLYGEDSLDGKGESIMYQIRGALEQEGKPLRIKGLSFGNVEINTDKTSGELEADVRYVPDVANGPQPTLLSFELKSGPHIATLIWECKFYTHTCIDSVELATLPAFTSFTAEIDFDVQDGLVRRLAVFEAHIPNRRGRGTEGEHPIFSPDDFSWIADRLPIPEGFRRRVNRKISKDYLSIVIRVLDEEIPSNEAFAPYLINVSAPFSVRSQLIGSGSNGLEPQGFSQWVCSLSFQATVQKLKDKRYAAKAFYDLLTKKYAATKARSAYSSYYTDANGVERIRQNPGYPILLELEVANNSYSLDFSARAVWLVPTTTAKWEEDTMLFEEEGRKWSDWLASMAPAFDATGISNLVASRTDLPWINACNSADIGALGPTVPMKVVTKPTLTSIVRCPPNRQIGFDESFKIIEKTNSIVHSANVTQAGEEKKDSGQQEQVAQPTATILEPIIQNVGQSEYVLEYTGWVRATTTSLSPPSVLIYQGAFAKRIDKPQIKKRPINGVGDCVIWETAWKIRYQLNRAPNKEAQTKIFGPRSIEETPESEGELPEEA